MIIYGRCGECGQVILRCKYRTVNSKFFNSDCWEVIICYGRFGVFEGWGGVLRCKCRVVNWKFVTVYFGRTSFVMTDVALFTGH